MDIRTVKFEQLTCDELTAWSAIQRLAPHLSSPFFRPEFAEAVASVRDNVEVAILLDDGRPVGFLPFERIGWSIGIPVGGELSDFHGLIAPAEVACDPAELLNACRLTTWSFSSLVAESSCFQRFFWHETNSPHIELSGGFAAYVAHKLNGRHIMSKCQQKLRKLSREVGPVRFENHNANPEIISALIAWKSDQYLRTGIPNLFDHSWVTELLLSLLRYKSVDFSSSVAVLYAGDSVAAINFGIRSGAVLQPLIPTYNTELSRYSPGLLHWIETIRSAESVGIRRIELGKGPESYKWRLMTGVTQVAEGLVDAKSGSATVGRAWCRLRERVRCSPLAGLLRRPVRIARRACHWAELRLGDRRRTKTA